MPGEQKTLRRASIEALVIAIGVLTALLADNWNEDRKDRQVAQQFLDGVVLDLKINTEQIKSVKKSASEYKASLEKVILAVQTGENSWDSPGSFVEDLVVCTYLGIPNISSIAFDELQSTGSMRLIEDVVFKRSLASYYQFYARASLFHPEYRRKEAAVEEALLGFLPLVERLEISDERSVTESTIDVGVVISRLQAVPNLVARLEDMVWVQHRVQTRYDVLVDMEEGLLDQVQRMR